MRVLNHLSAGFAAAATLILTSGAFAQSDDVQPSPPSIGADVPLTYFGPAPSSVQKELIGPHQLLTAGKIDVDAATITMLLYKGKLKSGETVWYIVTDTTDAGNASQLGINYSPKLVYSDVGKAVRHASLEEGFSLVFESGKVDFSPVHDVTPGDVPNFFPPKSVQPGSVGDDNYSPLKDHERGWPNLQRADGGF